MGYMYCLLLMDLASKWQAPFYLEDLFLFAKWDTAQFVNVE